jgi:Protein of unknown function (DUF2934)
MSTKSKRNANARRDASSTGAETPLHSVANGSPDEEIRRRAYDIYLERGNRPGSALDDWLQAEREVQQRDQSAKKEHDDICANR